LIEVLRTVIERNALASDIRASRCNAPADSTPFVY
jgi:hypothetical protein